MGDNRLDLEQSIGLRLSQQQLRYVRLLEMTAPELDDAVDSELEDNPALTADELVAEESSSEQKDELPYYRYGYGINGYADTDDREMVVRDDSESLYDYLNRQISELELSSREEAAAHYIIGNLDADGYLRRPLANIIDDLEINQGMSVSEADVEKALKAVRSLEPHGLAAFDLRESLILQLESRPRSEVRDDALKILRDFFEPLSMNHVHRIISGLKKGQKPALAAIELIRSLNPRPGASFGGGSSEDVHPIIPDLILEKENGRITLSLNNRHTDLAVSETFESQFHNLEKLPRKNRPKGSEFITSRRNDARDFIRILRQRQETVFRVASAILKFQKTYFDSEDVADLKPMMMKDIAAITGDDLSVISRATNNKYLATPWGIFPLRYFFSDSLGADGGEFTNREMEQVIRALVAAEDRKHPLSDEAITQAMKEKGYDISRRTVAKYRDRLKIPVARLRKDF